MVGNDTLFEAESVKYLGHAMSHNMSGGYDISRPFYQLYAQ